MYKEIEVDFLTLKKMRARKNIEIFSYKDCERDIVNLIINPSDSVLMRCSLNLSDPDDLTYWNSIKNFVNMPIVLYDKRIVSHDLANVNEWPKKLTHGEVINGPFVLGESVVGQSSNAVGIIVEVGTNYIHINSISGDFISTEVITSGSKSTTLSSISPASRFTVRPDNGFKYILTHSIVRFPDNLKLTENNKLHYEVWLSPDGLNPPILPTISLIYKEVPDLFRKATAPFTIAPSVVPELGEHKEVEVLFQYANPYTLEGSPIILHSSLNEKITLYLEADTPLLDINSQPLNQECNISMNFKKTLEF